MVAWTSGFPVENCILWIANTDIAVYKHCSQYVCLFEYLTPSKRGRKKYIVDCECKMASALRAIVQQAVDTFCIAKLYNYKQPNLTIALECNRLLFCTPIFQGSLATDLHIQQALRCVLAFSTDICMELQLTAVTIHKKLIWFGGCKCNCSLSPLAVLCKAYLLQIHKGYF